jgi:hypothetical protein
MRASKQAREQGILDLVDGRPVSAVDLVKRHGMHVSPTTVSRRLTLHASGEPRRKWDGNQRFGRYVNWRADS